ncbi:MAG: hypothetical protein R3290_04905 [Acidimicrobiia bacterium]|nr:hypothetical protein [Acidimicrobiia bacterium]
MPHPVTGIGRPIDPRVPSNLFVIAATLAGGAAGFFPALGDGFGDAVWAGVLTGGAGFVAWAVGRELDPDRPATAGVAAVVAIALAFVGDPGLALSGAAILATRILVRTTGVFPTVVDLVVVAGFAAYVATRSAGLPVAVVTGLALLADGRLPGPSTNRVTVAGDLIVVAAIVAALIAGTAVPDPAGVAGWEWLLVGVAVVGAVVVVRPPLVSATADWSDERLDGHRLRAGRVAALAMVAGAAVWGGAVGLAAVAPVSAAMAASLLPLPVPSAASAQS